MSDLRLEVLRGQGIVPVIRAADVHDAVETARACARAGMRVVELTHTTPDVERAVATLRDEQLVVGVGTVTDSGQVRRAAAAGASFVVSFATPDGVVETAERLGLLAIPGVFTAGEALTARGQGAVAVKLFPARALPPACVGDLQAVMPGLEIMATGGLAIADGSAQRWLAAGALAVGLGSELGSVARHGADEVTRRAARALALLEAA
jgi:2-dehydro-3-deoxyphosphogluconate aldolase / (4S)-4-hydroxy-2-oxoglutarate aldolase